MYNHPIFLQFIYQNLTHRIPILFYKPVTTLIGPLATIVIPKVAQPPKDHLPDYEVELVIVIGKQPRMYPKRMPWTTSLDIPVLMMCVVVLSSIYNTKLLGSEFTGIIPQAPDGYLAMVFLQEFW